MKKLSLSIALFLIILPSLVSFAQDPFFSITRVDTFVINLENHYELKAISVIPLSEKIRLMNRVLPRSEYKIDYTQNSFSLSDSLKYSIFDTLYVSYRSPMIDLNKEYFRRKLVVKFDETMKDSIMLLKTETSSFSTESIFGRDIQKSGAIIRGFTVGTNKDFSLNSGLRLSLSGKLSDDIEIVAALTDENTPIQPEGNTETLDELDKVFIQVKHPNATGTFGDYDLRESIGEFGKINRKLQGLKAEARYGNYETTVAIASSRGEYNSMEFSGTDGNQGPYRLTGKNNEREIIVIAGSEKVFIDGLQLKRGEDNDYTIEYSTGEITFTPKKLITSASRITVDFEYTVQQYQRNIFGANFKSKFFDDRLGIKLNFFQEADDKDNTLEMSLSDQDKETLAQAGDDRNKSLISGVTLARIDSTGKRNGSYSKIDTTVNGEEYSYYRYEPNEESAIYYVTFSYVGEGKGDYRKESLGNYKFTGIGQGNYLPVRYLPMPEIKQIGNIVINAEPWKNLRLGFEFAGSSWDKNRFSDVDDKDNFGHARNITLNYQTDNLKVGSSDLGKFGFSLRDRFVDRRFTSLDRFNQVEFNRDYNISEQINADEVLREAGINYQPVEELNVSFDYGLLEKGNKLKSNRYIGKTDYNGKYYGGNYQIDYVDTKSGNLKSNWAKHNGGVFVQYSLFKPGVNFIYEKKKDYRMGKDSLLNGSHEYKEIIPFLELVNIKGLTLGGRYSYREEAFPVMGELEKESEARSQSLEGEYRPSSQLSTAMSFTYREKEYTKIFKEQGRLDNETYLIRSQTRFNLWDRFLTSDIFYEAATEKTARLERIFVRVQQGRGNYIYLGDLNNNGIADEEEFEPTIFEGDYILRTLPTDELFPVIDLKASTRWKLDFAKVFKGYSFTQKLLQKISTETLLRVEENTKDENLLDILMLDFNKYLNPENTMRGSNLIQQDLFYNKNKRDFSLRFRYIQRNNLNQFSGGTEKGYFRERGARVRFALGREVANQTEFINQTDNVTSKNATNRAREVLSNEISTDFSYRPVNNVEFGFTIKSASIEDKLPEEPTIIDRNSQQLRFTLSFAGRGRLRIEGERNELVSSGGDNSIPFEITRGDVIGKNYIWRLNFDYKISGNLQTTVGYNGRKQGHGKIVHLMRAEARAFF